MTNQQGAPETLRLADALDLYATGDEHQRDIEEASAELRRLHAENERLSALVEAQQPAPSAAADPLDWPLPCDVTVGHGTMCKGVSLRTLVTRMKVLYEMATGHNADEVAGRTPEQRAALFEAFRVKTGAAAQPSPTPQADIQPAPLNAWQQAIDHELVIANLGVAGVATFEEARKAIQELIAWHVEVATDPATNGGKVLVDAASAPADSAPHPIDLAIAADLERSDWTPEEALRWYAAGKHYDTVPNGDGSSSARILDNGAVASNALKSLSREYAQHKGDVALTAPQADSQPAPQGETNAQLDIDSNSSAPGQQRDVAGSVALGQPVGNGSDQAAGHTGAQGDKLLIVAERNIRSFLRSAVFKSESDREAALNCVDVLWEAASAPADSVLEDAARYRFLAEHCRSTSEHWGGRWSIIINGPAPKSHDSEDDFDEAVDAARKQGANHD